MLVLRKMCHKGLEGKIDNHQSTDDFITCRYCANNNPLGSSNCERCGVALTGKPFLTDFQLEPCPFSCSNLTVHIKARTCPLCKQYQPRTFKKNAKVVISDCYEALFIAKESETAAFEQLFMYLGIVIGVYFSNRLRDDNPQKFSGDLILAGLAALLVMPAVFDKVTFKDKTPVLVRFALYFQSGVFADTILLSLEKGGL